VIEKSVSVVGKAGKSFDKRKSTVRVTFMVVSVMIPGVKGTCIGFSKNSPLLFGACLYFDQTFVLVFLRLIGIQYRCGMILQTCSAGDR
jgi:hypothetical protein